MASETYALRYRLIQIACREIGVEEIGTSNSGPRVKEYQAATSLGGTGWPWCAAFVCWCIREWGKDPEVLDALKLTKATFDKWRPKTAAAFGFHEWAADRKLLIFDDSGSNALHTGDIMTFDISHVELVQNDDRNGIYTIGGNTSKPGSGGSERNGGGVWPRVRRLEEARRFIRILP